MVPRPRNTAATDHRLDGRLARQQPDLSPLTADRSDTAAPALRRSGKCRLDGGRGGVAAYLSAVESGPDRPAPGQKPHARGLLDCRWAQTRLLLGSEVV